jgi:DNA-binding NarL/FixJ family response regulator
MTSIHDQNKIRLTQRQQEVLSLVAEGHTNAAIARRLHIAEGTVKRHLHDTFVALQVSTRGAAVHQWLPMQLP